MFYKVDGLPSLKQRGEMVWIYTHDSKYYNGIIKSTIGGCIDLYLPYNKLLMYIDKYTILQISDCETDIKLPRGLYWQG